MIKPSECIGLNPGEINAIETLERIFDDELRNRYDPKENNEVDIDVICAGPYGVLQTNKVKKIMLEKYSECWQININRCSNDAWASSDASRGPYYTWTFKAKIND